MELLTENENKKNFIWKHAENKQNKAKIGQPEQSCIRKSYWIYLQSLLIGM